MARGIPAPAWSCVKDSAMEASAELSQAQSHARRPRKGVEAVVAVPHVRAVAAFAEVLCLI